MEFRRTLVRGSIVILSSSALVFGLGVIKSIIVARLLDDPELIGLLGILATLSGLFGTLAAFGIPTATARYVAQSRADGDPGTLARIHSSIALAAGLSVSMGLVMYSLSWSLSQLYQRSELIPLLQVGAAYVSLSSFAAVLTGSVRGLQRMGDVAAITVSQAATAAGSSIVLILWFGVLGAAYALLSGAAAAILLGSLLSWRATSKVGLNLRGPVSRSAAGSVSRYALPIVASGLAIALALWIAESVLALLVSFFDLGLYRIGFGLYNLLVTVPAVLAVPLMPLIAEMNEQDPRRLNEVFSRMLRILIVTVIPLGIGVAMATRPLIRLLYGDTYVDASEVATLLVLAAMFVALTPATTSLLLGSGRSLAVLGIDVLWAGAYVGAVASLAGPLGLLGMGFAHLSSRILVVVATLGYLRWRYGLSTATFRGPVAMASGAALLVVLLSAGLPREVLPYLGVALAAAFAVVGYAVLTREERGLLKATIRETLGR